MMTNTFNSHRTNPHAWMAQMINYAVTGTFFAELGEQRRLDAMMDPMPGNVLAFPIQPDGDYVPELAANEGPLPEAA